MALREVASWLQSQAADCTRAINLLHNLLARVFPERGTLTNNIAGTAILNLLSKYPSAEHIARARLESLQRLPHLKPELGKRLRDRASHIWIGGGSSSARSLSTSAKFSPACREPLKNSSTR